MGYMGQGYWLNPANDKFERVSRHEISAFDPVVQKKLGLTKAQKAAIEATAGKDEDTQRMAAVNAGLIRIRDYQDGVHVQFSAPRDQVRTFLNATYFCIRKAPELKTAWAVAIENMHPAAKDFNRMDMADFKKAIEDDLPILREKGVRRLRKAVEQSEQLWRA